MSNVTFDQLRQANVLRLPQFKNRHGGAAHTKQDGSDWTPAQWLQAVLGELGEYATVRLAYETGRMTTAEYADKARDELADVATYLDIAARRCMDKTAVSHTGAYDMDPNATLMGVVALLGTYANARKKYERGDYTASELYKEGNNALELCLSVLGDLRICMLLPSPGEVVQADPHGVNLGAAVLHKFNVVSERVGSSIRMLDNGGVYDTSAQEVPQPRKD